MPDEKALAANALPDYDNPPLDEIAVGVHFEPLSSWQTRHIGQFWGEVSKDYPSTEDQPPILNIEGGPRHLEDTLEPHARLDYKAKSQGKGKPYLEGRTGDDLYHETGKWMLLERVIDHAKNWYKKLITDPETGKVVHHCEEPLTNHRGHGSAKKKSEP